MVTYQRAILAQEIVPTTALPRRVAHYIGRYGVLTLIMGDRTGAKEMQALLRQAGLSLEIVFVDEDRSSELGRRRFLLAHPGRGWQRLLPLGLRTPDRPYDDFVAVILAERYLDGSRSTRLRATNR